MAKINVENTEGPGLFAPMRLFCEIDSKVEPVKIAHPVAVCVAVHKNVAVLINIAFSRNRNRITSSIVPGREAEGGRTKIWTRSSK